MIRCIANQCGWPAVRPSSSDMRRKWAARGSSVRYTRCPKPMIFFFCANADRTHASARSGVPISSSIFITSVLAPPCSGPASAARAPVTAPCMSASVAAITRAANVDALSSWSACRINATSSARAASASGTAPDIM